MFGIGKKKEVATENKDLTKLVARLEEALKISESKAELESLRKDNTTLIARVGVLESANKELKEDLSDKSKDLTKIEQLLADSREREEELESRLKEADEQAAGTPVNYASARKALTKAKLKQLRTALEAAPNSASGFGGSCSIYDKKTKRVSLVEFKSKSHALEVLEKAEKGHVDIIM